MSYSNRELNPAQKEVNNLIATKVSISQGKEQKKQEKRIIRYKPAVTKVEEWTRAEIGVGAAIARGSQGEKGKMALLVMKATHRKETVILLGTKEENT